MKKIPPVAWLAVLLIFLVAPATFAQSPTGVWRSFDHRDGISANWVFDITQTPDAALWFATDAGVYRFDGFWREVNEGLPATTTSCLAVDSAGNLWVGTARGPAIWQDGRWRPQGQGTELAETRITDLLAMPDGEVWAASPAGVFAWSAEGGWRRLIGLPFTSVTFLVFDGQAHLWMADGAEVAYFQQGQWQQLSLGNEHDGYAITALVPDRREGVWIATSGRGVTYISPDGVVAWTQGDPLLPAGAPVLSLLSARDGALWAGTQELGVVRFTHAGWEDAVVNDALETKTVTAIYQDWDGVFWLGTSAGVIQYDPVTWMRWQEASAPPGPVTALAYDIEGTLWAAGAEARLFQLTDEGWRAVAFDEAVMSDSVDEIETLFVDREGMLWIGLHQNGVLAWDGQAARRWRMEDGLADNAVTAIAQTPDGAMWFGTRAGGLSRWDGTEMRTFTQEDGLLSNEITALSVDAIGALWVGTRAGVTLFDGQTWQAPAEGLEGEAIIDIAQGEQGTMWVATSTQGLLHWQEGQWTTIEPKLDGATIQALLATPGRIWVARTLGMDVFDGVSWQRYREAGFERLGAIYVLAAGKEGIYLGGEQGVVRFRPDGTSPNLQLLTVNGRTPEAGEVMVEADAPLQLFVQGGDLHTRPDDLQYMAKIQDADLPWYVGRNSIIALPPQQQGDYALQVLVRDASLNYSKPVTVTLRVRGSQAYVTIPGLGHIHPGFAFAGVLFLALFMAVVGYASWTTALRWHMRQQAVERHFNPYIVGSPIRSSDMFFGREKLLRDVEASLAHNSMMLYGERRIGKTSLLYRLLEDLRQMQDKKFRFFPVFVDLEGTPEDQFFHQLMEGLLEALQEDLADFPAEQKLQYFLLSDQVPYTDRHMRRDLRQIISHLKKKLDVAPRILFLLDEADTLSAYSSLTQQQFRRILQDTFARNVGAVISGVHISKAWDRMESPWYNMFVEVVVSPLNRYESELLMRKPVLGFYEWDEDAVNFVWEHTHGRPHRIQQIAREAVNIMLDEGRRRITLGDVRKAYERVIFAEKVLRNKP